jgi:small subunit ribosomal protein S5
MNDNKEFAEKIVQVNRVSKKTKGGNRIGFSVVVVVGDRKGRVAVGLGKAPDVKSSIQKGVRYAKKHLITVPLTTWGAIPHDIYVKLGAAKVLLRRAPEGTGVIAGGAVRAVVEAAGVRNIVSKVLGTSNQASNVYATLEALKQLSPRLDSAKLANRGEPRGRYDGETVEKKNISKEVKIEVKPITEGIKQEVKAEEPKKKGRKPRTETK